LKGILGVDSESAERTGASGAKASFSSSSVIFYFLRA
jgi:hypothetical protein